MNPGQNVSDTSTGGDGATASATPTTTKEKKIGWFHSLTRRKKSQSQNSINCSIASVGDVDDDIVNNETNAQQTPSSVVTCAGVVASASSTQLNSNNNNEPTMRSCNASAGDATAANAASCSNNGRKRKEEKNAFQRFRKKMGLRFPSLRRRKQSFNDDGATTDASSEFLTHSPIHEPLQFNFKRSSSNCATAGFSSDENDTIPFTNDFKRFIKKKWLERAEGENRIMYDASSEMLK